jgi:hypothetical protein
MVSLPGSGLRAATALVNDMIAARLAACAPNANPSHCPVRTPRTLKAQRRPSLPHHTYDMPASRNRLGPTGLGSLLPGRIVPDSRTPGAVRPRFRHIPDTFLRLAGAPNCLEIWAAILRVLHVDLVLATSMISDSILPSIA